MVRYGAILIRDAYLMTNRIIKSLAEKRLDCGTIFADAFMGVFT
jgi:hypothetical protein